MELVYGGFATDWQTRQYPAYADDEDDLDEIDRPLISRPGGLLTELEAPYVAEAERLERFDSGERRYDIIKLPHIGGGIINSIVNMSNSIIGAGNFPHNVFRIILHLDSTRCRRRYFRVTLLKILIVGIIGLPYAFNRAGLVLGVILLFVLTGIVDWTIRYTSKFAGERTDGRLIVINAKLSGSGSYQDTVAACFGHGGLVYSSDSRFLMVDCCVVSTVLFCCRRHGIILCHYRYSLLLLPNIYSFFQLSRFQKSLPSHNC